MIRTVGAFLLAIAIAGPAGAAESPPKAIADLGGRRVHYEKDVVDVAIAEADRTRVDEWDSASEREHIRVLTGPLWATVFRGDPRNRPVFTITSSKVTEDTIGGGTSVRVTYAIEGTLSFNGQSYAVREQGSQSTGRGSSHAFGAAATKCVVLTARRVSRIVSGDVDTPPPAAELLEGHDAPR